MLREKKTRFIDNFTWITAVPHKFNHALRGLMKRKFPNPKSGTLDVDLASVIDKFVNGINYSAVKDEYEKDFGLIETVIGMFNMNEQHLEENFASLIQDVYKMKPKRSVMFISRCPMICHCIPHLEKSLTLMMIKTMKQKNKKVSAN